jgi:hydroxymethylglutaryl-CoA reductase
MLHTRGKRVVAEAVLPDEALRERMGVDAVTLGRTRGISMMGAFLAGSADNGAQAANALAALIIATATAGTGPEPRRRGGAAPSVRHSPGSCRPGR